MFTKNHARFVIALTVLAFLPLGGCHGPGKDQTATELTHSHMDRAKALYGRHLDEMADNAILQDMSLVDFHFVAHSAEISGTGAERLNRMAHLLNTYGGTVRYDTQLTDATLVNQRIDHVKEYLTVAGTNMDRVKVQVGMSGGRGMPARTAMEIDARGTARPTGGGQTSMMMTPAASSGQ